MVDYNIYSGGQYLLDENYGEPFGYSNSTGNFGMTLDPRTANQLGEVSRKLNTGLKQVEVQGLMPNVFEAIPEQHLKEINRLNKITGTNVSMHGPLVEASGFDQQAGRISDTNRTNSERQINLAVERAHKLNPDGNIVVTFHSTTQLPEMLAREKTKDGESANAIYVVNPQSGAVQLLKESKKYFPQEKEGKPYKFDPNREIEIANRENWENTLRQFAYYADLGDTRSGEQIPGEVQELINQGKITKEEFTEQYPEFAEAGKKSKYSDIYLRNSYNELKQLFEIAYESALDSKKVEDIKQLSEFRQEVLNNFEKLEQNDEEALRYIVNKGVEVLHEIKETPKIFKPLNEFVIDKSSETFSNAALNAYKKFKDKAPIISIENPPAGSGISRGEDLKKLIEESREKFAEKLHESGKTKTEAKAIAEKMIGATWDVGHINMIKRFGYDSSDVVEETKKIKPYLKHIHLSDNFGFDHTELPMGMGNVPMKEILKQLGKKGEQAKKIIEAGDWFQHFKTMPVAESLSAFGSPIYAAKMQPYWNQVGTAGAYWSGYGTILPDQHFSTVYGAGFSSLPQELGGQIQSKQSRFSGTPNA